jgi:transaldolase
MKHPIVQATLDLGQSIWLDFISRHLMDTGELNRVIEDGVRGMTSNPTIFENAILKSTDYDADIREGIRKEWSPAETFEHIAVTDVTRACDALRPVFNESGQTDGNVSIEVSPGIAYNTARQKEEALRLWKSVNRPNLMVKVPGTREGIPAIRELLIEGLNINITLMFSLQQYRDVLEAYLQALEERVKKGLDVSHILSVASFFVSRVDTVADKQLGEKGHPELQGKAAIANACLAYRHFLEVTASPRWKALAAKGAHVQRLLWASTSTKNPAYLDVIYVQELVAKDTVNTMPPATLDAWKDHGKPENRLLKNLENADRVISQIRAAGVDLDKITEDLIDDGVKKFSQSYDQVIQAIQTKVQAGALK